jgi:REP-associated tyrosine transposase
VQYLKGKSSHKLLAAGSVAEEALLGSASVVARILVATSGNVTDEVWKKYIEDQKPEEPPTTSR